MIKAILTTIAAVLALGLATADRADAAPSPTLDGETLVQVSASDVQSKCDVRFFGTSISWQASGAANGAYAGTFSTDGTASLYAYMNGGPTALTGLDATFTIASRAGTLKG